MRLRNDPKAHEIVNENELFLKYDLNEQNPIAWPKSFANGQIYLEIGSGKGDFIINNALTYLNINFIGVEKSIVICSKIYKKIAKLNVEIPNLRIINCDAKDLLTIFNNKKVSKIYLNFSDPWPKKRHHKYRLTHNKFLQIYEKLLADDGIIELKTDNDSFYTWSLEEIKNNNWEVLYTTSDLYSELNNKFNSNNIKTEYEKRFIKENKNINKIIFKPISH